MIEKIFRAREDRSGMPSSGHFFQAFQYLNPDQTVFGNPAQGIGTVLSAVLLARDQEEVRFLNAGKI
jgi:hypothetical protein